MTPERPLRTFALILVYLLTAQFLLGMYLNLFVTFPQDTSAASWAFAWGTWPVVAHIVLGAGAVIGTAVLCVRAWQLHMRRALLFSILSLLSLLLASASGALFVTTQAEAWSYSMATFFIVAMGLLSYVLTARREHDTAPPDAANDPV